MAGKVIKAVLSSAMPPGTVWPFVEKLVIAVPVPIGRTPDNSAAAMLGTGTNTQGSGIMPAIRASNPKNGGKSTELRRDNCHEDLNKNKYMNSVQFFVIAGSAALVLCKQPLPSVS